MVKVKLYYSFLFVSLVLFLTVYVSDDTTTTIDINIHDTYFVIKNLDLCLLFGRICLIYFAIYFCLDKAKTVLTNWVSKIHIFGSLLTIVGLFLPYSDFFGHYRDSDFPLYDNFQYINMILAISVLLFLLLQFLFIINIFASIIKKIRQSK